MSRPGLSCLLAVQHVCSCKSHQIRGHRTGKRPVESHSATQGYNMAVCRPNMERTWRSLLRYVGHFRKVFLKQKRKLLVKQLRADFGELLHRAS